MTAGYVDFEFDLPGALLSRLVEVLDGMDSATLNAGNISEIPEAQGVYQLLLENGLVYIGKTDSEAGLSRRLSRHHSKIQHRIGLEPEGVSFKAVRIYVFTAVDLEAQLISHYGGEVEWNGSGFGSNDPGRERDTSRYREGHFDLKYPIDIDRVLGLDLPNSLTAAQVFTGLKTTLPYVFRFQGEGPRSRRPHPDLVDALVSIPETSALSVRQMMETTVPRLPAGWRATKLPSHIILYKNDTRQFPSGEEIARSG